MWRCGHPFFVSSNTARNSTFFEIPFSINRRLISRHAFTSSIAAQSGVESFVTLEVRVMNVVGVPAMPMARSCLRRASAQASHPQERQQKGFTVTLSPSIIVTADQPQVSNSSSPPKRAFSLKARYFIYSAVFLLIDFYYQYCFINATPLLRTGMFLFISDLRVMKISEAFP